MPSTYTLYFETFAFGVCVDTCLSAKNKYQDFFAKSVSISSFRR